MWFCLHLFLHLSFKLIPLLRALFYDVSQRYSCRSCRHIWVSFRVGDANQTLLRRGGSAWACTEISAAPVISSTYISAIKTEFICGSHRHYSMLALSSAWQDRTGQCSCNLYVKELWWSSLAQVNETCQLNLLDEWSVQAKQLFNYDDVRIRGPVWDVVSTRCHHTERNGFLLLLVRGRNFTNPFCLDFLAIQLNNLNRVAWRPGRSLLFRSYSISENIWGISSEYAGFRFVFLQPDQETIMFTDDVPEGSTEQQDQGWKNTRLNTTLTFFMSFAQSELPS